MFAFFGLGIQELVILALMATVPIGVIAAILLISRANKDRKDD